ncbi:MULTISPECIES: nucleotidyltransferase family protein [Paenibacillus]|uniref:Nucleotidyltransferase family protein n=1 Tax=Paenibacillus campinasensis TaxID=66347 RepID=A0A268EZF9_9BACL|nr:nucleotidyltransferase family protein [Paenibacillus campinasensis]MUG65095.1 hypothetical protein [Paenibacillus campinasensis]PAD78512.1 hypothetical protein CHH67_06320 [Paenibacillus campinasensis]
MEDRLQACLSEHASLISDLKRVRALELPDWCIAAGYIRNYVWDRLHGYDVRDNHSDIDVVYYDRQNLSEDRDRLLERHLREVTGNGKWSVKNQARMHVNNGDSPYADTANAMAHWPETATAVGVRLDERDHLVLVAPYGVDDLFELKVRQSPLFKKRDVFLNRVQKKGWLELWPQLTLIAD